MPVRCAKGTQGRDQHPRYFTIRMAGGGIKPEISYGHTDAYGYNIADAAGNPLRADKHVHDLQATILHLKGVDHSALTYLHQGRRYRLTDVHGHVVKELLA
jgi:hypothetical protein